MIFLIRHADAVSPDVSPERPLSPRGHEQVQRVCAQLRSHGGFGPVEFWHSPLVRSRETAQGLATGLGLVGPVILKSGLEPDDDPAAIIPELAREQRDIAIVGHEPYLGILATLLVHGPAHGGVYFPFPKAAVLAVTKDAKGWKSEWWVRSP
jgi:phosphohistidine phosphatase